MHSVRLAAAQGRADNRSRSWVARSTGRERCRYSPPILPTHARPGYLPMSSNVMGVAMEDCGMYDAWRPFVEAAMLEREAGSR